MTFSVKHFIDKFKAIPEEKWISGSFHYMDRHCALGHLGEDTSDTISTSSVEADELRALFLKYLGKHVVNINDGNVMGVGKFGDTPRIRILNALKEIQKLYKKERQELVAELKKRPVKERFTDLLKEGGILTETAPNVTAEAYKTIGLPWSTDYNPPKPMKLPKQVREEEMVLIG